MQHSMKDSLQGFRWNKRSVHGLKRVHVSVSEDKVKKKKKNLRLIWSLKSEKLTAAEVNKSISVFGFYRKMCRHLKQTGLFLQRLFRCFSFPLCSFWVDYAFLQNPSLCLQTLSPSHTVISCMFVKKTHSQMNLPFACVAQATPSCVTGGAWEWSSLRCWWDSRLSSPRHPPRLRLRSVRKEKTFKLL